MSIDTYLQIIKTHYPQALSQEIKAFLEGNDHFVFVVHSDVLFRFPRIPQEISPVRKNFLDRFVRVSPILTPTSEIYSDEETGISYEIQKYMPGVSFYPAVSQEFQHDNLLHIAQKLGAFLTALHSFPLHEARLLGVGELDASTFWEYMQENENAYPGLKSEVFPHLSEDEQKWMEKLYTDYIALIRFSPFTTTVTHSDMWVYHIIVNPQAQTLSGVIDFSPRIADPARDFKAFEYYGKPFVDEVYKHYRLPVNEAFEKRRLFYTGHDEIFEFARVLERGDETKILLQKRQLSAYIRSHPL